MIWGEILHYNQVFIPQKKPVAFVAACSMGTGGSTRRNDLGIVSVGAISRESDSRSTGAFRMRRNSYMHDERAFDGQCRVLALDGNRTKREHQFYWKSSDSLLSTLGFVVDKLSDDDKLLGEILLNELGRKFLGEFVVRGDGESIYRCYLSLVAYFVQDQPWHDRLDVLRSIICEHFTAESFVGQHLPPECGEILHEEFRTAVSSGSSKLQLSSPLLQVAGSLLTLLHDHCFDPFLCSVQFRSYVAEKDHTLYNQVAVDDFEFFQPLGKGGFGRVVEVRRKSTGRRYAMKILPKCKLARAGRRGRLRLGVYVERNMYACCRSPFIANLAYATQTRKHCVLVMELVDGGRLAEVVRSQVGGMSEEHARFYLAEVVVALQYLHSINIMYRDMKLENVLLDSQGHVKLVDLGLVREIDSSLGYPWMEGRPCYVPSLSDHWSAPPDSAEFGSVRTTGGSSSGEVFGSLNSSMLASSSSSSIKFDDDEEDEEAEEERAAALRRQDALERVYRAGRRRRRRSRRQKPGFFSRTARGVGGWVGGLCGCGGRWWGGGGGGNNSKTGGSGSESGEGEGGGEAKDKGSNSDDEDDENGGVVGSGRQGSSGARDSGVSNKEKENNNRPNSNRRSNSSSSSSGRRKHRTSSGGGGSLMFGGGVGGSLRVRAKPKTPPTQPRLSMSSKERGRTESGPIRIEVSIRGEARGSGRSSSSSRGSGDAEFLAAEAKATAATAAVAAGGLNGGLHPEMMDEEQARRASSMVHSGASDMASSGGGVYEHEMGDLSIDAVLAQLHIQGEGMKRGRKTARTSILQRLGSSVGSVKTGFVASVASVASAASVASVVSGASVDDEGGGGGE